MLKPRYICVSLYGMAQTYTTAKLAKCAGVLLALGCSLLLALSSSMAADKEGGATEMTDIEGIDELKAAFAADAGSPRMVLLLSPT